MPTATPARYAALVNLLLGQGAKPCPPPRVCKATQKIDAESVRDMECPDCGRIGMAYSAWDRAGDYIAIARCQGCGWAEEF